MSIITWQWGIIAVILPKILSENASKQAGDVDDYWL